MFFQSRVSILGLALGVGLAALIPQAAQAAVQCEHLPAGMGCRVESCDLPAAGATETTCEYSCGRRHEVNSRMYSSCVQSVTGGKIARLPIKNLQALLRGSQISVSAANGAVGGMPDHTGYTRCSIRDGSGAPAAGARCRDCDHDGVFHWVRSGCGCSRGKVVCEQVRQFQQSYEDSPDKWVFDFSR